VTFEYLWIYHATGGAQRVATDQQHILNVGMPLIFSWLLYEKRFHRKLILGLLLVPMGFAVLVTLTRMLWASIPLSLLFALLLYLRKERKEIHHFVYAGVGIAFVVLFILFPIKKMIIGQENLRSSLQSRIASLTRLRTDLSLLGRVELVSYVWPKIKKSSIVGTGLGDVVRYKFAPSGAAYFLLGEGGASYRFITVRGATIRWMDISYFQVLWKIGVIGLILFIGLYTVFIRRCWFVFKNTTSDFEKWASLGIFVSFITLLAIAFLSAILVGYRFNLTWAVLMGIVELWAQRIERDRKG
jgi:O-antigen ligase